MAELIDFSCKYCCLNGDLKLSLKRKYLVFGNFKLFPKLSVVTIYNYL